MSMMKNFTKILLGLSALATNVTANAMDWEWRNVINMDFGGNDKDLDPICSTKPSSSELETDLTWIGRKSTFGPGKYMIIKATQLADVGSDFATPRPDINLTNWGTMPGAPSGSTTWASGGDHTYQSDNNIGYYMAFDCLEKREVKLYKKALPISCAGVEFKLEAYFASLDKSYGATTRVSILGGGKILAQETLELDPATSGTINWQSLSTKFKVDDSSISSVDFLVEAINCYSTGWDIALDDITISVNQPVIKITGDKFYYKEPATLKASYEQEQFDAFFGTSNSDVVYRWYKKNESTSEYEEISGAGGNYTPGGDISYTIPAFEKDLHNGTYRLIVSPKDNLGSEMNLCSIQTEYVINQEKDEVYVEICKDSTVTLYGYELSTKQFDDQYIDKGSIAFNIKCIKYTPLETKYDMQCLNSDYPTVGDIKLDDIIERDPNNGCPLTVQKHYIRVTDDLVTDDPKHLCQGDKYITDDNVDNYYTEVDESGKTRIEFDADGCRHEQYIYIHPNKEEEVDVTVCKGDSYDGVPYNKVGTYTGSKIELKTIHGCDSIITPNITVVEPVEVTKSAIVCPSDNYEFDGKIYNYPIDTTIVQTLKGQASNGCDSTTTLHLVVNEGGEVHLDTLICREQILFGDSFMVAGTFQKKITGYTESGCPIDTIWNIEVVQISLRLRMFGGQDEICEGQPATMEVNLKAYDSKNNGKTYTPTHYWEPEVPQNVISPTLYLNETTTYTIYADLDLPSDIDKNAKGCHAKESKTITVHPMPELSVDSVNPDDRSVEYTVTGGTMPYHMFLGSKDLGILESNSDKKDHLPYGKHMLQVQDSTGCSAEQEIVVEATQPEPDFFFSPNGDGEADIWKVKNLDVYPNSTIRIYDRYGKVLYSSSGQDFENGWDGTYNGSKMPATDYWYEITIDEIDQQYFGHFTLIR